MKNVSLLLLLVICLICNTKLLNAQDNTREWQSIPAKSFQAYSLILKEYLTKKSTNSFSILEARKRPVAFYENTWLFHFVVKENKAKKNIKLLCNGQNFQMLINQFTDWAILFEKIPPNLNSDVAVLDLFTCAIKNIVLSEKDLPKNVKANLNGLIQPPRIMFQNNEKYTIQSFVKKNGEVFMAIYNLDIATKIIKEKGKSNLFLNKNHRLNMVLFNKTGLLYSKSSWAAMSPLLSQ